MSPYVLPVLVEIGASGWLLWRPQIGGDQARTRHPSSFGVRARGGQSGLQWGPQKAGWGAADGSRLGRTGVLWGEWCQRYKDTTVSGGVRRSELEAARDGAVS